MYGSDDIECDVKLPIPIVEEFDGIRVVRDDLLDGGTKRRAFTMYVASRPDVKEFVYASPRQGYAQLSLAYACHDLGRKCTVTVPKGEKTWLTIEAEKLGCNIIQVPMGYLSKVDLFLQASRSANPSKNILVLRDKPSEVSHNPLSKSITLSVIVPPKSISKSLSIT